MIRGIRRPNAAASGSGYAPRMVGFKPGSIYEEDVDFLTTVFSITCLPDPRWPTWATFFSGA